MHTDLLYQIALSQIPNIGCVRAKTLADHFDTAEAIFKAKKSTLERIDGIGTVRAESIKNFTDFTLAEQELKFTEKYKIQPLFITSKHYPQRLLNCYDSPTILYYRGEANLNYSKTIAVIGTRSNTEYGKSLTEKLLKELASEKILVLSGLAFGIDTYAHKAALKNSLPTVGVLAHGLDTIYPAENTRLAKQMVAEGGGILSEFASGTKPDKHNFPTRNRIVAGMADATIVIETDIKGGSMITAELANNYNRDVFAFPGKTTDAKSKGCNYLVRSNKAALITCAQDLLEHMGWLPQPEKKNKIQRELFIELTADEKILVDMLNQNEQLPIDEIYLKSQLSTSLVAAALLSLELQGIVMSLPGKVYKLL
ncbi:MAG: DNA-processing protein DprA [Chitinophagaceae bacterium]